MPTTTAWRRGDLGVHLGIRVRQREDHSAGSHRGDGGLGEPPAGHPHEHVGAAQGVRHVAAHPPRIRLRRQPALVRWQIHPRPLHDATAVAHHEVGDARLSQDPGDRHSGGPCATDDDAQPLERPAQHERGVPQAGEDDDGRAVLVVVEDRQREAFLQPPLDLEAPRRRDVLEVDATERGREPRDGVDDLVDVGRVEADGHRVQPAEVLEEQRLPLHHREGSAGPDVAEPEDGGPVGDDRDRVGAAGVAVEEVGVGGDRPAHVGDAGRVRQRQVAPVAQRDARHDFELAALVQGEDGVVGARVGEQIGRRIGSRMGSGWAGG